MYRIYFNNRVFVITDTYDDDAKKVHTKAEMGELVAYFASAHQLSLLRVYNNDAGAAFAWFSACFILIEAAGGLVQNKNNDYLLIYRFNHWDLPKGKREKNETIEQTAVREVEEECALSNLVLNAHITNTYHTYQQKDVMYLKKTYWYKMYCSEDIRPTPQAEEGIEKAMWVKSNSLHKYFSLMYASAIEVFKKQGIKID